MSRGTKPDAKRKKNTKTIAGRSLVASRPVARSAVVYSLRVDSCFEIGELFGKRRKTETYCDGSIIVDCSLRVDSCFEIEELFGKPGKTR